MSQRQRASDMIEGDLRIVKKRRFVPGRRGSLCVWSRDKSRVTLGGSVPSNLDPKQYTVGAAGKFDGD